MRSRLIRVGAVAVALAVLAVVLNAVQEPSQDGPLQMRGNSLHVKAPAAAGEPIHWAADIPFNPTSHDMHLRSVALVGTRGLEVLGIVLSYAASRADGTCVNAGTGTGFPPGGEVTSDIAGAVLPSSDGRTCQNHPAIVVGVRRPSSVQSGAIDSVVVVYESDGRLYRIDLAQSLEVVPPQD